MTAPALKPKQEKAQHAAPLQKGRELAEVANQHDVAGDVTAREKQLAAVARPGEIEDAAGSEIGYLTNRAAGERLLPDVA